MALDCIRLCGVSQNILHQDSGTRKPPPAAGALMDGDVILLGTMDGVITGAGQWREQEVKNAPATHQLRAGTRGSPSPNWHPGLRGTPGIGVGEA